MYSVSKYLSSLTVYLTVGRVNNYILPVFILQKYVQYTMKNEHILIILFLLVKKKEPEPTQKNRLRLELQF